MGLPMFMPLSRQRQGTCTCMGCDGTAMGSFMTIGPLTLSRNFRDSFRVAVMAFSWHHTQ